MARETNRESEVGNTEQQRHIAEHTEHTPPEEEQKLRATQQGQMESRESTADGLVAISEQVTADQVHDAGNDTQNAECPAQPIARDDGTHCEGVDQAAETRSGGVDAHRYTAVLVEPLRGDTDTAHEEEAHAPAETDALAEEDVPFLGRE